MFSRHRRMVGGLHLLADALVTLASFMLAYWTRSRLTSLRPLHPLSDYSWIIVVAVALWIGVGLATGAYRDVREEQLHRAFADPLKVGIVSTTLLFAFTFALKLEFVSRLVLGLYFIYGVMGTVVFRLLARRTAPTLRRAFGGFRHFLVVGSGAEALEIARSVEVNENQGMRLFGFVLVDSGNASGIPFDQSGLRSSYPFCRLDQLAGLLRRHVIDEVIFAVSKTELEKLEEAFLVCEEEGVKTRVLLSFFPHVMSKVYLERLCDRPLLTFSTTPEDEHLLFLKRVVDFVMALVLLVVLSPLFLLLALLVKLTSKGPVLYRQTRCGLGGRRFTVYKFRSMDADADQRRQELEALNEMDGPVFKIKHDPRCTPVGRLMRRFSLDELPQLVNILKGEMSFVGPRPPLPEEVDKYEPWQRRRLRMQPGLTCLWALKGRNKLSFNRWMELDLEYIDNWSPALDCKILLKTIPSVLLGRGAS